MAGTHRAWSSAASSCVVEGPQLSSSSAAASRARTRATWWECTRARGEDGWEARIAGIDTIQARCSISSTIATRPLPSLDPPRHTPAAGRQSFTQLDELHKARQQRVDDLQKCSACRGWAPYRKPERNPAKKKHLELEHAFIALSRYSPRRAAARASRCAAPRAAPRCARRAARPAGAAPGCGPAAPRWRRPRR